MHGWVEIRADHHLETRRAGGSCLPGGRACVAGQGWPGWPAMKQQCLKADHRRRARGRDAQLGEVGLAAVGQTGRRRRLEGKSQVRHLGLGTGGVSAGHIRPYGRHGRTGSMQRLGPAAQSGFGLFLCDTGRDLWDAKVGELGQPVLTSGSRKYIAAFFFVGVQSFDGLVGCNLPWRREHSPRAGRNAVCRSRACGGRQGNGNVPVRNGGLVSKAETFCRAAKRRSEAASTPNRTNNRILHPCPA